MVKAAQPDKLLCPCCGKHRPVADITLLQAEADWLATGAFDSRRPPGWSVEAARAGKLQWACVHCFDAGRALEGHPALQTWCDPYFSRLSGRALMPSNPLPQTGHAIDGSSCFSAFPRGSRLLRLAARFGR